MWKFLKILVIIGYIIIIFRYLRTTLSPSKVDISVNIEYVFNTIKPLYTYQKNLSAFLTSFKRHIKFGTDLRYILKYTDTFLHRNSPIYKNGQSSFIENNCSYYNCYFTNNMRTLDDVRRFDAILFDVENGWDNIITIRDDHQKFIFVGSQSAEIYPICDPFYEDYFNLTWTYRLDSDIPSTALTLVDKNNTFLGPKVDMNWAHNMLATPKEVIDRINTKSKAVAWFVSKCQTTSNRMNVTNELKRVLSKYGHEIDIFGRCGNKRCPKSVSSECDTMLQEDYYFYLSFESSLDEDYVTEVLLRPLLNYAVPIVYGGANYSRFLPPGSYINARELNATSIAALIHQAINNPEVYEDYFRWHYHYTYLENPVVPNVCELCRILNEDADKRKEIKYFRKWWNPNYQTQWHAQKSKKIERNYLH